MKNLVILATLFLFPWSIAYGQSNFVITSNSAGGVRLGMTVSQARKSLKGCKFERSSDGEGVALIMITCSGKRIISVFAGEEDIDAVIDARAKIVFIEVWDKRFKTADGVHPDMYLRDAEKILGKIRKILIMQTESREFVTFRKNREGIEYRTYGGIYTRPSVTTTEYEYGSRIVSIQVS